MRDDLFYRVPTSLSVGDSNIDDGRSPSVLERMELTEMRMFLYLREPLPRGWASDDIQRIAKTDPQWGVPFQLTRTHREKL